MKNLKFLCVIFLLALLVSCSGKKDNKKEDKSKNAETTVVSNEDETESSSDYDVVDDEDLSVVTIEDFDDDDNSSSSSSNDYDAMLDSYEKYVDSYVSVMKKAAAGDMTALTEYPALFEKAEEFSDQMSSAQGSMTTAQWTRYIKITQKMMDAVK